MRKSGCGTPRRAANSAVAKSTVLTEDATGGFAVNSIVSSSLPAKSRNSSCRQPAQWLSKSKNSTSTY